MRSFIAIARTFQFSVELLDLASYAGNGHHRIKTSKDADAKIQRRAALGRACRRVVKVQADHMLREFGFVGFKAEISQDLRRRRDGPVEEFCEGHLPLDHYGLRRARWRYLAPVAGGIQSV